jgi:hypothetical protein
MLAFTDSQLRAVWAAAARVPIEKRGVFLERVVARLSCTAASPMPISTRRCA